MLTVGVPKEIKTAEHRVAMTPDGVRELERHGVAVFVETGAGAGASIPDADYAAAGADDRADRGRRLGAAAGREGEGAAGRRSSRFLRADLTLFTYLHLAAYPEVAKALLAAGTTGIAYETVQLPIGRAAAAGADERGRRPARPADRRPLPRAPQRRPRRAARRRARRAAGAGRGARRRQRRLERGVDRRRHGGRGHAARQEPRPPALGRPDPPGPHHDAGVEPRRGRAQPSPTPTS